MAGESLRALRRGLSRADGFALFLAVCNSPAERMQLIEQLAEALPDKPLVTVSLTDATVDPLDEILHQLGEKKAPVMLTDLERAIPSAQKDHPVLQALNLRRAEWPVLLTQPVVFWVPEYLLGLLGREAPDFLDWRSDTVYFPTLAFEEMKPLLSLTWVGGVDGRMPEPDRRARIDELRSRVSGHGDSRDPVVLKAVAGWLVELGNHLKLLGHLDESERVYHHALETNERLGRQVGMAVAYGNLGLIYLTRGDLDEAERMNRKALEIYEQLGHQVGLANAYTNLGLIYGTRGDLDEAERMHLKALEIDERLGRQVGMASAYTNLGLIYQTRHDLDEAERIHRKALEINERLGRQEGMAVAYGNLGLNYQKRGDLDEAERMNRKALEIYERLGRQEGMANAYGNLGVIYGARGDLGEEEGMHRKALEINERLGRQEGMAIAYFNLGLVNVMHGNLTQARDLWRKARDLFAKIGIPHRVKLVEFQLVKLSGNIPQTSGQL